MGAFDVGFESDVGRWQHFGQLLTVLTTEVISNNGCQQHQPGGNTSVREIIKTAWRTITFLNSRNL
jgi:hypothetical protein